ncbi:MAG: uracil phosphoribosyltransferase, partial [Ignavibacteria bacterium]
MFNNLKIIRNPLSENYLTFLRDKKTSYTDFRSYLDKLSLILAYESAGELSLKKKTIFTPLAKFNCRVVYQDIILVPVLRAGLGLVNGFTQLFPHAKISHIGIYRNEENLKPVKYYFKFPGSKSSKRSPLTNSNRIVFILDPMLATGGSINCTIASLKKLGIKKIIVISIVSSPEGVKEINKRYKNIKIYTCALDEKLNDNGYIVPGLGDAGDRLFGT